MTQNSFNMDISENQATSILQQPAQSQQQTQKSINSVLSPSSSSSSSSSTSTSNGATTCIRQVAPQAFKFFMEQHAENVLKQHKLRNMRREQLEIEMDRAAIPDDQRNQMRKLLRQKETNYLRLRRAKMNKNMFMMIMIH